MQIQGQQEGIPSLDRSDYSHTENYGRVQRQGEGKGPSKCATYSAAEGVREKELALLGTTVAIATRCASL